MCVRACMCVYVYVCVRVRACVRACVRVGRYACVRVWARARVSVSVREIITLSHATLTLTDVVVGRYSHTHTQT